ncbi:MAG: hypothetical protein EBT28_02805, partial [Betaproteobacteria bacterium]|nr:hypothetical protein [Betaproteobacteria bacterium]
AVVENPRNLENTLQQIQPADPGCLLVFPSHRPDLEPSELMVQLDVLEEVAPMPSGEYQRINTLVLCGEQQLACEVYELSADFAARSQVLGQGNWLAYAPDS